MDRSMFRTIPEICHRQHSTTTKITGLGKKKKNNMDQVLVTEQKKKLILELKENSKASKVFLHLHRDIVITFVEAIEKVHHYFDFTDYLNKCDFLKHDSPPDEVYDILVNMPELKVIIEKVDKEDLLDAINWHIKKVKHQREAQMRHDYANYLPQCEFITSRSNFSEDMEQIDRQGKFAELSSDDRERALELYKRHLFFKFSENLETDFYCHGFHLNDQQLKERSQKQAPLEDPIYNLVFQTRKGNHCMDLNPEVEVRQIKKSNPFEYYSLFVDRMPRLEFRYVQSKMVKVMDVPYGAFVRDIKKFFSGCGKITYVKFSRGDKLNKSQILAFKETGGGNCEVTVVFKETGGANCAAQLTGKEMVTECGRQKVKVARYPGVSVPTYSQNRYKDDIAARKMVSALEKAENAEDVGNMLAQVLHKYWYYSQRDVEVPQ